MLGSTIYTGTAITHSTTACCNHYFPAAADMFHVCPVQLLPSVPDAAGVVHQLSVFEQDMSGDELVAFPMECYVHFLPFVKQENSE